MLRNYGLLIGSLDVFQPLLLKPEAVRWRAALLAVWRGQMLAALPDAGAVCVAGGEPAGLRIAGFRPVGAQWLRSDMVERIARQAHAARLQAATPRVAAKPDGGADSAGIAAAADALPGFAIDAALATSLGLADGARRQLLAALGFRAVGDPAADRWRWTGKVPRAPARSAPRGRAGKPRTDRPADSHAAADQPTGRLQPPRADYRPNQGSPSKAAQQPTPSTAQHPAPGPARPPAPARTARSASSPFAGLADLIAAARKAP